MLASLQLSTCAPGFYLILTRSATTEAYLEAIEIVRTVFILYDCASIKVIRTDIELKLVNSEVESCMNLHNIVMETSSPYAHYQNGAERSVQTIIKGTSSVLHGQVWLRADLWNEVLRYYTHTRNHTPNAKCGSISPWKRITGRDTDLSSSFRFAFGDLVAHGIPKELREWKFDVRNELGIYVGQPDFSVHSHRIYDPFKHRVYDRQSVHKLDISDLQYLKWYGMRQNMREAKLPYRLVEDAVHSFCNNDNDQSTTTFSSDSSNEALTPVPTDPVLSIVTPFTELTAEAIAEAVVAKQSSRRGSAAL
jgi:hypothetical protein